MRISESEKTCKEQKSSVHAASKESFRASASVTKANGTYRELCDPLEKGRPIKSLKIQHIPHVLVSAFHAPSTKHRGIV